MLVFFIVLAFSLGQIWKAHEVAMLCTNLDSLRCRQQSLEEKRMVLQLKFDEISKYSRIEPLAREVLGMHPSRQPPVVIAPLNDHFFAFRQGSAE